MFTATLRHYARRLLFLLVMLVLPGCGGGGGNPGLGSAAPTLGAAGEAAPAVGLFEVANGLSSPVFLTSPENDRRLFIVERGGRIRIVQNGTLLAEPFLDIGTRIAVQGEGGLLSLAFHPQYAGNGFFFVYYTDIDGNIVVERFSVSQDPNRADPTSGLPIIRIAHPNYRNHYGGLVAFGPDGLLYLGTGDGGGAGDPERNAQDLGVLLGKILRLDVGASSIAQPYTIPLSNPFAGQAGRRAEIWAFGLRNPWRFTFDANWLFIADVGQQRREEVNIVSLAQGGQNFGWNVMEGGLCFASASCGTEGLVVPQFEYDHGPNQVNGCSISGGFVYRGKAIPQLAGHYFYSDYCAGFLKSFVMAGRGIAAQTDWRIPAIGPVLSFGRDADGELYLLTAGGQVFRIVPILAPTR